MFDGIKVDPHLVMERAGFAAKEFNNVTAPIPHVHGGSLLLMLPTVQVLVFDGLPCPP